MKIGLSTYSLLTAIRSGEMTVLDVVDWIADHGGEHMELVPYGYTVEDNYDLADAIREKAEIRGIELSNYSMPANFVQDTEEEFEAEVARVKRQLTWFIAWALTICAMMLPLSVYRRST